MQNQTKKLSTSSFYLLPLLVVPVAFTTVGMDVFNTPKAVIYFCLIIGALVHLLLSTNVTKSTSSSFLERNLSAILVLFSIGITAASLLSDTTLARMLWGYPGRANGLIYYFAVLVTVFVGIKMTIESNFPKRLFRVLNLAFLSNIVYGLIQFSGNDPISWNYLSNPIVGTFGNPNFAAVFLGIGAFFYLVSSVSTKGILRFFQVTLGLMAASLSVATQSIQGPAVMLFALTIYIAAFIRHRISATFFYLICLSLVMGASLLFLTFLGFGPLGEQFYQYTLRLRVDYWLIGIKTALNWPLTGVGTDSYVEGFKLFRTKEFIETYGTSLTADAAHSVPLNFLANFGFINFALYLSLILVISSRAFWVLSKKEFLNSESSILSVIWLSMVFQSLFSLEQIGISAFQWLVGALLLNECLIKSTLRTLQKQATKSNRLVDNSGTILGFRNEFKSELSFMTILFCLILLSPVLRQEVLLRQFSALSIQKSTFSDQFIFEKLGKLSYISKDETRRSGVIVTLLINTGRYVEASKLLKEVLAKDPQAFAALEDLIGISEFEGDLKSAVKFRSQLKLLVPLDTRNLLGLAKTYATLGQKNFALANARLVVSQSADSSEIESATAIIKEFGEK
jgi:hypothetical protein